jgi:hypothetical protein
MKITIEIDDNKFEAEGDFIAFVLDQVLKDS